MKMTELDKTYNVSGIPHTDSEHNVRAWRSCGGGIIKRTGFQVIGDLEKLHREREVLEEKIESLAGFIETAEPIPESQDEDG